MDRRLCADQIAITRQQATDIPRPVRQVERLMASHRASQPSGIQAAPGAELIQRSGEFVEGAATVGNTVRKDGDHRDRRTQPRRGVILLQGQRPRVAGHRLFQSSLLAQGIAQVVVGLGIV